MRDSSVAGACPPPPPVETLPLPLPEEVRPPVSPPREVCPSIEDVPAAADTVAVGTSDWGEHVADAVASGGLVCDPAAIPQWAKPTLSYSNIIAAMRLHYLEGAVAVTAIAEKLYAEFNCGC